MFVSPGNDDDDDDNNDDVPISSPYPRHLDLHSIRLRGMSRYSFRKSLIFLILFCAKITGKPFLGKQFTFVQLFITVAVYIFPKFFQKT